MPGEPHYRDEPPFRNENVVLFRNRALEAKKLADQSAYQDEERARVRTNVAALILAAVLVCAGWFLVHQLGRATKMQDCLISGRTNCNPITLPIMSN